jgi:HlyD family secretion protein
MSGTKLAVVAVLAALALGFYGVRRGAAQRAPEARFAVAKVERGDVVDGVHVSGTVQPRVLVAVGTQVSGVIEQIFKDWNDPVKAGEVIAVLDSRRLVSQVLQDEAAVLHARADLDRVEALLEQAEADFGRTSQLAAKGLVPGSDYDAAKANYKSLRAQKALAASVVSSSDAILDGDQVNLRYATVISPVDGVIVSRNVDVGQTVAAALQTPTLFQIANDLKKVQVQASVPEADVGRVKVNQRATFKVDAYRDRVFEGVVSQIRLASTTVSNVVTYTVIVDAENPDELLLPGMTANAIFEVRRESGALSVPTSALRFDPPAALVEASTAESKEGPHVFVKAAAGLLRRVPVVVGVSDGIRVTIASVGSPALDARSEVVTGILQDDEEEAVSSPFGPPKFAAPKKPAGR